MGHLDNAVQNGEAPFVAPPTIPGEHMADLPGYCSTPADRLLDSVFGDHLHSNPGFHLDGGVPSDQVWQQRWKLLVGLPSVRYNVPKGVVGRRFITTLTTEFRMVRERQSNSERPLVFVAVVLPRAPGVRAAKDIRLRLAQRLDLWDQGQYQALVDDTEAESLARRGPRHPPDDDTAARRYNARVLSGRLRQAVRSLTDRGGGGSPVPGLPGC